MLQTALLISNRQELLDFLNSIAEESFIDITRLDTKWKIIQISNITSITVSEFEFSALFTVYRVLPFFEDG